MVIIGSKIVPDEEPKPAPPRSKYFDGMTQNFTKTWTICFDRQLFSTSANNTDEDHDGGSDGSGGGGGGGGGGSGGGCDGGDSGGDSGGELKLHNERKHKGKKRGGFGNLPWKMFHPAPKIIVYGDQEGSGRSTYFSLRLIKDATRNFNLENKIGKGGFGSVYKGILPDGRTIAVKKLSKNSFWGFSEFASEETILPNLIHSNIIKLYGSCREKNNHLLVYEYMQNGGLDNVLSLDKDINNLKRRLDWETKFKICIGIAKGLAYLHKLKIVHRDIKSSNILLDGILNPKISDFGLSMYCQQKVVAERVAGTPGYMAPENLSDGIICTKTDVYSFGVLTLELMSGKKVHSYDQPYTLPQLAVSSLKKGCLLELIDEDMKTNISVEEATVVLNMAMLCILDDPTLRPSMSDVVSILEGKTLSNYAFVVGFGSTITIPNAYGRILDPPNPKFKDEIQYLKSYPGDSERVTITDNGVLNLSNTSSETEDISGSANKKEENVHTAFSSDLMSEAKVSVGEGEKGIVPRFKATTLTPNGSGELEYVELCYKQRTHHIECTEQELEIGCDEWKDSLVGYFLDEIEEEHFNVDNEMVRKLWAVKGIVSVFTLGNGYFLFRFDCVEDKIRVLESSNLWQIVHRSLVLMKWDWKMKFDKYEMKSVPLWVKIYNLPLVLWSSSFLCKVGSGLGILLHVDQKTKDRERLDYAKICVQMDASKPLLESWNISLRGIDYQLKLEYDFRPLRCTICYTFGHIEPKCVFKKKITDWKAPKPDDNVFCINEQDVIDNIQDDIIHVNNEICTEKCTITKDMFKKFLARASSQLDVTGKDVRIKLGVDVFSTNEDVDFYLSFEDISYICNCSEASLLNVVFFIRLLSEKIVSQGKEKKFGFLNPVGLCTTNVDDLSSEIFQGLSNAKGEFMFIPYLKNSHWILMVIKLKSMKIWWLDPLQQEMRYGHVIMKSVVKALESTKGIKNVRDPTWCFPSIVPKQKGNWECGYYVMRYMKEIIEEHPNPISTNKNFIKTTYNDADIDEIRFEWITYLGQFLKTWRTSNCRAYHVWFCLNE